MSNFVRASSKVATAAFALLALSSAGPASSAMAGQFSVGVIEYNAKESQGGWTTGYGNVLAKQIKLIVERFATIPVQAPCSSSSRSIRPKPSCRTCIANDDTLVSCALEHNQLPGWTTIVSDCEPEQIELAYSKDWKLVAAPNTTNPRSTATTPTIRRNSARFAGGRKRMAPGAGLTTSPILRTSPARRPCCS